jgi:hypothetical protein
MKLVPIIPMSWIIDHEKEPKIKPKILTQIHK